MKALLRKVGGASVEGELVHLPDPGVSLRLVSGTEDNFSIYATSIVESVEKLSSDVFCVHTKNSKYILYLLSNANLLREV